ncbi:MAG: hypothetical protein WBK55_06745 [Alphaproteobacteria bacterium]
MERADLLSRHVPAAVLAGALSLASLLTSFNAQAGQQPKAIPVVSAPPAYSNISVPPGPEEDPAGDEVYDYMIEAFIFSKTGVSIVVIFNEKEDPERYRRVVEVIQKLGEDREIPVKFFAFRTAGPSVAYYIINEDDYRKSDEKDYGLNELPDLAVDALVRYEDLSNSYKTCPVIKDPATANAVPSSMHFA